MKKWGLISIVLILSFFIGSSYDSRTLQGNGLPQTANIGAGQTKIKIDNDYGKMPLSFIPNKGQMDKQVYFYIQGKDKNIYFTSAGLTYSLSSPRWVVKLDFVGARKNVKPEPLENSGTVISYFKGKAKDWKAGLQVASKIIYRELWPGIDLVYYGTVNKMKYEFIVHPGTNPSQIKLAYRGADSVKENKKGQLEVKTKTGGFVDDTPVAWQEIAGKQENVPLKYKVESGKETQNTSAVTYGFSVGKYDKNETLILDPTVIIYCGYIGGSSADSGRGIAVDSSGCAYVAGNTGSTEADFPVTVGPDLTYNSCYDVFVAKIKTDGTGLVYCGYIGGSANDYCQGIAIDAAGCVYVTGETDSGCATFPVTVGPDLTYHGGSKDAFVAKINAAGTGLDYCGYIGGTSIDSGCGIAVDTQGCAYVTGFTGSTHTSFPVKVGPDLTYNSGYEAFVAKVKADGTELVYCGYIGGSVDDKGYGIGVDSSGYAYVSGHTNSTETSFPVTIGPDLTYNGGDCDAFVAKVNAAGIGLVYCGYIGGSSYDWGRAIAVDTSGCAFVAGQTNSNETSFPVAVGPVLTKNGYYTAFVAKVNAGGTALNYCGYIGGSYDYFGPAIAVDGASCAYVAGTTQSSQPWFPVIDGPDLTFNGVVDAYVAKVNAAGTGLDYCGYIGGDGPSVGYGIAVDGLGCAYITGETNVNQATFPVTVGPDLTHNGGAGLEDAFVAKISGYPTHTVNFAAGNGGALTGITTQTVVQEGDCAAVTAVPNSGYQFVNWTGTEGFVTTTDNPLTVTNVTADMTITAHFLFTNPAGWVPVENLQYNMVVYGKAYNGNNPAATGDWIGAFGPGGVPDCRGAAAVQTDGNYFLIIGGDTSSGETISFKLWPLSSGSSIDGAETVDFIENGVYNGLPLHFGPRGQNIALVNGWNWISFNVLPANSSLNSVFTGLTGAIEQVKSQTHAAIYSGGNWIGDLTDMSGAANGIMYKVKTNQDCVVTVSGPAIPFNQPLSLISGWNWTAYLPSLLQPLEDAIDSIMTPVSQVKSQYKAVIKIGSSLYGDLTLMEPNKGYTILMNAPGTLVYPYGVLVSPVSPDRSAQVAPFPLIKGNQYNMVAYGKVFIEGKAVTAPGYYLVSVGPKGENDNRSYSPVKADGSYFSTILGNIGGEIIKFKLYNSANKKTYDLASSLSFQPDGLKAGYNLKTQSIALTAPNGGEVWRLKQSVNITWRSKGVDNVKIELYKGTELKTVIVVKAPAGTGKYTWTIPANQLQGTKYKIKVSSVDTGVDLSDTSDKWFSITSEGV